MFKTILRSITKLPKLESLDSYMFIGPHPDDIEMGCGATVKKLTDMGKKVVYVVATDGRVGSIDPALSGDELVKIRQQEVLNACKLLNVQEVVFLPFHDGCQYTEVEMRRALAEKIALYKPDAVFCPDHKVRTECHPDHITVGQAATYAVCTFAPWKALMDATEVHDTHTAKLLAYYYTDKPNCYVNVSKTFEVQTKALLEFKTQFTEQDLAQIGMYRKLRAIRFGLRRGCGKCDGFRALNPIRMHCFPEAAEI